MGQGGQRPQRRPRIQCSKAPLGAQRRRCRRAPPLRLPAHPAPPSRHAPSDSRCDRSRPRCLPLRRLRQEQHPQDRQRQWQQRQVPPAGSRRVLLLPGAGAAVADCSALSANSLLAAPDAAPPRASSHNSFPAASVGAPFRAGFRPCSLAEAGVPTAGAANQRGRRNSADRPHRPPACHPAGADLRAFIA